ncbi:generic methyl-transferase [Salinisphaera sp. PC39]|uniref:class I SAM-dependent methyltransferase n=1 Tax=Salinisphaera sp. PC39 TaxID=1304156 RepID=UPI00333F0B23
MPGVRGENGTEAALRWLETPRGRLLLRRQREQLLDVLPHLYGYRLLQIGDWGLDRKLLESSATLCHWVLGRGGQADVLMDGESLPVCSRCLDAVILPHSLELASSPHRLLREVDRVLCDHGHVVILGFNPYTPWWLWSRVARRGRAGEMARHRRCYALGRVRDWLDLLDFELVRMTRFGVGFPYASATRVRDEGGSFWRQLPAALSQSYLIVARKRVVPLTPVRPAWRRPGVAPLPGGVPEPTPRVGCASVQPARRAA